MWGTRHPWIHHKEIAAGGVFEFVLGAEPNKQWVSRTEDPPPRRTPFNQPRRS